jgi:hypothetical protein
MVSWCLFIDVEGFSAIYGRNEAKALILLKEVGNTIHAIGSKVFPDPPARLFAYGLGDGFLVVPDLDPINAERPLAIALVLMHHLLSRGGLAKSAISVGGIADISSCFPKELQQGAMGQGVLTTFNVMGTALSNAYKLGASVRGACLLLDARIAVSLPSGVICSGAGPLLVDWIHSRFTLAEEVADKAGLDLLSAENAERLLLDYIRGGGQDLPQEWIRGTLESVNCTSADAP